MLTRRQFLKGGLTAGAGAVVVPRMLATRQLPAPPATPQSRRSIAQFVDPLPALETIVAGSDPIELHMIEFQAQVLPIGSPKTWVWGYLSPGQTSRASYIGPVIVARRGVPTTLTWVNELGTTGSSRVAAYAASTDQTLHWADPLNQEANACAEAVEPDNPPVGDCALHYSGPILGVAHLHGGEVPSAIDGGPDAWFASDGAYHGHAFYSGDGTASNHATYRYPNGQEAAPIWFHDHTLGVTRLGVYAGLAGAYLVTDPTDPPPPNLQPIIPLVLQDRSFDGNGQLLFPAGVPFIPNPEHPFWVPEFIGDTIVVNGKAWPYVQVEAKRYRFLFLNGSNARTYEMFLTNPVTKAMGPPLWQIATDGGYLDTPVKIDPSGPKGSLQRLVLMPGERADVIVDFGGMTPGTTLVLRNIAKAPYPGGDPPDGRSTGRILQVRVVPSSGEDSSYDPASGAPLRAPMIRLVDQARGTPAPDVTIDVVRQLTLNEVIGPPAVVDGVVYEGGPLEILLNNTEMPGVDRPDFTPITVGGVTTYYSELPHEGETELWEIVNLTADAHPIHLHLVQFQLMNRQRFDVKKYTDTYFAAFPGSYDPGSGPPLDYNSGNPLALGGNPDVAPYLRRSTRPPEPNEAGWKDTIMAPPGQVTRIMVRWAPTDLPADTDPVDASYAFDPDGGHGYVWHCHILDHEDNEMMRPTSVQANDTERTYVQGRDY
jgi:spore coat protein A